MRALPTALALVLATLAGCKAGEVVDPTPPNLVGVSRVRIVAPSDTLFVADTARFTVESQDANGNLIRGHAVTWRSSAPAVASIQANGLVTALGPGQTTITAETGGKSDTLALTVVRVVFRVNVVPDAVCLRRGFSTVVQLTAYDSLDQPLPAGLRPVTWRTTDGGVVAITPQKGDSAIVLGIAAGPALITASLMGVADTTAFIVDPTPLGQPLSCGT
ncbi:MAG TPA: Ig-like domain-containing protein [Gemmatimonadales bacterium]|nr:Ig-like domain-containing protein [Gemmatimonadales bacterium]